MAEADQARLPAGTFEKVILGLVLAVVFPLRVTLHVDSACRPVALKVTVYVSCVKLAVIVPGALILTVVDGLVAEAIARATADVVHILKV